MKRLLLLFLAVVLAGCSATPAYWLPPSGLASGRLDAVLATPVAPVASLSPQPAAPDGTPDATQQWVDRRPETGLTAVPSGGPQAGELPIMYYAQAADTLPVLATRFGVAPEEITSADPIPETAYLTPGQLLFIPARLGETTADERLLPDSEVVYSPSAADFDVEAFVSQAGGWLSDHPQWRKNWGTLSAARLIQRVSLDNSINPRLLLALLEYQAGMVYGDPTDSEVLKYPLGYQNGRYEGLYRQLVWAVNQLSTGYYAYREGRMSEITFPDGSTLRLAPGLNAGTVALQYYFAQSLQGDAWQQALDPQSGFPAFYTRMFGDPWERARHVEPLFPNGLAQPPLTLPFARDWEWAFTGGPHGAWEQEGAYAALDFAPGAITSGCVDTPAYALASASGLVTRSEDGLVIIDLDGDGREQTGWVLVYLHLADQGRIKAGQWVDAGDPLGHPSCEGGIATGTHLHIARRFNGEWIPADGPLPFNLGGWIAHAGEAAYKGTLTRLGQTVTASVLSDAASILLRTADDP
jgi:LasA protease